MTVSTELSHEEYVGNGVTTDFDFRFRIFESRHLIVVVADNDGNETTLKNGTDYFIVGVGSYFGGKVVLSKPLAKDWKILLERDLPVVQETDLRNQGKFFAEVHEDAFDYLTMLIQKALGFLSLCLRKPSYLSKYYDAKNNRIENLGDPKKEGDATNKKYVDAIVSDSYGKTLRVRDKIINTIPDTKQRSNKILAFDDNGQPITILPEKGTASDVLLELAKDSGSSLIGDVNFDNLSEASDLLINQYFNHGDIYDVFVVYGQSNAVGYAQDTYGFPDVIDGAMYYDYKDNTIKKIIKALPYSSGNVSTGHAWAAFANEYIRKTGRKVLIIPCARGESSIVELSKPLTPSNTVYDKMISSFNSAMFVANRDGISIGYKSCLFHQGETDMTLGTKKQEYQDTLDQLIRDIRSDMGLNKCFLYRVGCPQNRKETSWYGIQTAQDYLCQSYDWMVMCYSLCGTFTISNGLLREGVHYTQNGYNVMGHESASAIVDSLFNKTPSSEFETEMYGTPLLPQDQIWRYTYGRLVVGSDGNLTLLDKSNTGYSYRTINISRIEMLDDKIRLYLQSRASWILGLDVELNESGKIFGVECFTTIVSVENNEFAVDLSFLMDVYFGISKDGDLMRAPDLSSSSIPPFISDNITIDKSNGIKIIHGGITGLPVLFGASGGTVSISNISGKSFVISSSSGALITLNRMKVKPTSLPRSMQVAIKAIICEKKE